MMDLLYLCFLQKWFYEDTRISHKAYFARIPEEVAWLVWLNSDVDGKGGGGAEIVGEPTEIV